MGPSFREQFDQFGRWRNAFAAQLAQVQQWLSAQDLLDPAIEVHLQRLKKQLFQDKLGVVFVAECSRGKSELINALFFAHYGRRIMPALPGRTSLCSTELAYDPALPPCLRLLPVETRAQPHSLAQWRSLPSTWVQLPLDVNDPEQLAHSMAYVAQTRKVALEEAKALGFWSDTPGAENPIPDAQGLVEIPKWRHALVNMAHPLLTQGMVIVDTPGLNAVGTEPELTVNLIAQAHAVVFLLAANAGVTPQDVSIWQQHLSPEQRSGDAHLVVMNKVDALRTGASSEQEVQAKLAQLQAQAAAQLGVDAARVVPVSAREGWDAKQAEDADKLLGSGLPALETALAQRLLAHRQAMLEGIVADGVAQLQTQVQRLLQIRRQDAQEQLQMFQTLAACADHEAALQAQQLHFAQAQHVGYDCSAQMASLRSEHLRLMQQAFQHLGATTLRKELDQLSGALAHSGLEVGVRNAYASAFERLRGLLDLVRACASDIQQLLASRFAQFNTQLGFTLQAPDALDLQYVEQELAQIEASYLHYLRFAHTAKLAHPLFGERMVRVLGLRLGSVFESAGSALDLWSQSAFAQLDAQCKERQRSLALRRDALERMRSAPLALQACAAQAASALQHLDALEQQWQQSVEQLLRPPALLGAS